MNKKRVVMLFFIGVLLLSVIIPSGISAEEGPIEGIFKIFRDFFGFLPQLLSKNFGSDPAADFYARFLIWMLVFAVLYWPSTIVFSNAPRGVVITVPLTLSIISVVVIPPNILQHIFTTYSVFVTLILWALPIVAMFAISHKIFPGESKGHVIGRIFIYLLVLMLYSDFYNVFAESSWARSITQTQAWGYAKLIYPVLIIMIIIQFFKLGGNLNSILGGLGSQSNQRLESDIATIDRGLLQTENYGRRVEDRENADINRVAANETRSSELENNEERVLSGVVQTQQGSEAAAARETTDTEVASTNPDPAVQRVATEDADKIANYGKDVTDTEEYWASLLASAAGEEVPLEEDIKGRLSDESATTKIDEKVDNAARKAAIRANKKANSAKNKARKTKNTIVEQTMAKESSELINATNLEKQKRQFARQRKKEVEAENRLQKKIIKQVRKKRDDFLKIRKLIKDNNQFYINIKTDKPKVKKDNLAKIKQNNKEIRRLLQMVFKINEEVKLDKRKLMSLLKVVQQNVKSEEAIGQQAYELYAKLYSEATKAAK